MIMFELSLAFIILAGAYLMDLDLLILGYYLSLITAIKSFGSGHGEYSKTFFVTDPMTRLKLLAFD